MRWQWLMCHRAINHTLSFEQRCRRRQQWLSTAGPSARINAHYFSGHGSSFGGAGATPPHGTTRIPAGAPAYEGIVDAVGAPFNAMTDSARPIPDGNGPQPVRPFAIG
jgi:hypothetical protein